MFKYENDIESECERRISETHAYGTKATHTCNESNEKIYDRELLLLLPHLPRARKWMWRIKQNENENNAESSKRLSLHILTIAFASFALSLACFFLFL